MGRRLFQVVLVLSGAAALAPRAVAAQGAPAALRFRLGQFVQSYALSQLDSVARARPATPRPLVVVARAVPECPMPVVVPDLAKSERMPVARINPAPYATRHVPVGCVNPLGPKPDTTAGRTAPIP